MTAPIAPVDTSVTLPASVLRAAEAANAAHLAAYPAPAPAPAPQTPPQPAPQPEPQPQPQPQPQPEPQPQPQPQPEPQPQPQPQPEPEPAVGEETAEQWRHRYLSMKGRFEQSQVTLGSMQQQMSELGDELLRTQQTVRQPRQQTPTPPPAAPSLITDEDVKTYGPELLDVVRRAAREAIAPDLRQVTAQTRQVSQQVTRQGTVGLYAQLDAQVPTWKTINVDPRFKAWCRSPDVYSGQVRGMLLNAALQAADAPRVIAFFNGFLAEEVATGHTPAPAAAAAASPAVPRQAAMSLDALTAPGRAKPATGDTLPSSADKPIFTRAQISAFYSKPVRDSYIGREQDRARDEQAIFAAQREGRVR